MRKDIPPGLAGGERGERRMRANPLIGTLRLVSFAARDEDGRITYPHGRDGVPAAN